MKPRAKGGHVRTRIADAIATAIHDLPTLSDGITIAVRERRADRTILVESYGKGNKTIQYRVSIAEVRGLDNDE